MGLGLTRDPYFNIGVRNMWANAGEQQFHLPVRPTQVLHGYITLVVPDLETLKARLADVEKPLAGTKYRWSAETDHVAVTCPWGNSFRCYAPAPEFGDMALGIPCVEFLVECNRACAIARFYDRVLMAPIATQTDKQSPMNLRRDFRRSSSLGPTWPCTFGKSSRAFCLNSSGQCSSHGSGRRSPGNIARHAASGLRAHQR